MIPDIRFVWSNKIVKFLKLKHELNVTFPSRFLDKPTNLLTAGDGNLDLFPFTFAEFLEIESKFAHIF